jgi:hypothetical protein
MTTTDIHLLYQQMGEVLSGLRCLHETIEIRHLQNEKQADLARAEAATARNENRALEMRIDEELQDLRREVAALRSEASDSGRAMDGLALAVQALEKPVVEIMQLRGRAAGLLLGLGAIGSAALWLAEPFYRWLIEDLHLRF